MRNHEDAVLHVGHRVCRQGNSKVTHVFARCLYTEIRPKPCRPCRRINCPWPATRARYSRSKPTPSKRFIGRTVRPGFQRKCVAYSSYARSRKHLCSYRKSYLCKTRWAERLFSLRNPINGKHSRLYCFTFSPFLLHKVPFHILTIYVYLPKQVKINPPYLMFAFDTTHFVGNKTMKVD